MLNSKRGGGSASKPFLSGKGRALLSHRRGGDGFRVLVRPSKPLLPWWTRNAVSSGLVCRDQRISRLCGAVAAAVISVWFSLCLNLLSKVFWFLVLPIDVGPPGFLDLTSIQYSFDCFPFILSTPHLNLLIRRWPADSSPPFCLSFT